MCTPDGRYSLVFNGAIYNYVELRRSLVQRGVRFSTTSDTEVLLNLLALDGARAIESLIGMFALIGGR
jgi:asparagine synthase (glutamine-hydrolysing)